MRNDGVNEKLIDRLAELSGLSFSESEKKEILMDLEAVLRLADGVMGAEISAADAVSEHARRVRDDGTAEAQSREELLACAPCHSEEYIIVPRVVANEGDSNG